MAINTRKLNMIGFLFKDTPEIFCVCKNTSQPDEPGVFERWNSGSLFDQIAQVNYNG